MISFKLHIDDFQDSTLENSDRIQRHRYIGYHLIAKTKHVLSLITRIKVAIRGEGLDTMEWNCVHADRSTR